MASLMDDVWEAFCEAEGSTSGALNAVVATVLKEAQAAASGDSSAAERIAATMEYLKVKK